MTNRAFSLLEVMIAIVLVVTSGVALMHALQLSIPLSHQNNHRFTALLLAQEVLEDMQDAANFNDLDAFNSARATLTGDFEDFDRAVSVGTANPKVVDVTVYWTAFSEEQTLQLSSKFSEHDY